MTTVCEWFGLKTTRTVFTGLTSKSVATVSSGLALKPAATISSGLASKHAATVSSGLASKPAVAIFSGLTSKPVVTVLSGLDSKPVAMVFADLASKPMADGFLVEPQNQDGGRFPSLGLKTGSSNLVIYASKLPRQFLGFGLKIKQDLICRLRHTTDGGKSVWDTRQDLAACFTWKQVWLGFPSLA
jgi:hypothetical protein